MRFLSSSSLLVVFFAAGSSGAIAQMPTLRGTAMLDCSGLPCVEVTVASGKHYRMLIDTGNVNSMLDTAVAAEAGLTVSPAHGADGKVLPGYGLAVLSGLKLGDASLGDLKVLVLDLASHIKRDRVPAADGALAYTAFKDRLLELDYTGRTVRVTERLETELPCPSYCGKLTTPTFGKKGPPILATTGFLVNTRPVTAQVDTLFSGTMLIYPGSVEKLGLDREATATKKRFFNYTDDGVDMLEAQSKQEAFGELVLGRDAPLYFTTPAVHLPDDMFDATVGHELFRHSVLSIDLHGMKLWIKG
ncbi:MAG TPA: retropepsin-like aspartic protease [Bryobacteraceae bacterium]|nr:retropepsin-like aspartic protease [Bryobacteraceae bacterium]